MQKGCMHSRHYHDGNRHGHIFSLALCADSESYETSLPYEQFSLEVGGPEYDVPENVDIADQHRGVDKAFREVYRHTNRFYCSKHRGANAPSNAGTFWEAVHAPTTDRVQTIINDVSNPKFQTWVGNVPLQEQFVSVLQSETSGHLHGRTSNQTTESYNGHNLASRNMHFKEALVTLVHNYRDRHYRWKAEAEALAYTDLPSKVQAKLDDQLRQLNRLSEHHSTRHIYAAIYEVDYEGADGSRRTYRVDLASKTCTCEYWALIRFPCFHARCVCIRFGLRIEDYLDVKDTTANLKAMYVNCPEFTVPLNVDYSKSIDSNVLCSVSARPSTGRPKGSGRKHGSMDYANSTCSLCGHRGHNSASCPGNGYTRIHEIEGRMTLVQRERRREAGIYIPYEKKLGDERETGSYNDIDLRHDA